MNRVAVVTVGDELLNGSVVDTSTSWIGNSLREHGFELVYSISVLDDEVAISDAILTAVARADAVLISGGLGPTSDDLTREGIARALRVDLVLDSGLLEIISNRYALRGISMPENAKNMAFLPEGASGIFNTSGSAPGIAARIDGIPVFAMPGVPHEMREMFSEVLEKLSRDLRVRPEFTYIVNVALSGESQVASKLAAWQESHEKVAYLASIGLVQVKVTKSSLEEARDAAAVAAEIIGDAVFAVNERAISLEEIVVSDLIARKQTLAIAESFTGGQICNRITDIPGASSVLLAGVIAYTEAAKRELGVEGISQSGTVSSEVASQLAKAVQYRYGSTWSLATTGVAGPGEHEGKSAGTGFISVSGLRNHTYALNLGHWASGPSTSARTRVRQAGSTWALEILRRCYLDLPHPNGVEPVG